MAIIDKVKQLRQQGQSADQIKQSMLATGVSEQEITDALSQTQIQQAVDGTPPQSPGQTPAPTQEQSPEPTEPLTQEAQDQGYSGMEPSMMQQAPSTQQAPEQAIQGQDPYQNYTQQGYDPNLYAQGYTQQGYDQSYNSDSVADIAEQAVEEKLSNIKETLDETLDFKSTTEAKLTDLQDRLKRLEKIIDKLQLAVLQKVGDYVTNTEDIKKELYETQKSFKSLLPKLDLKPTKHTHHATSTIHKAKPATKTKHKK